MKKSSIKSLLKIVKPHKKAFILVSALASIYVLSLLALPLLFGRAIDHIVGEDAVNFKQIGKISIVALVLVCIAFICQRIMNLINNKTTYKIVQSLRSESFKKIQSLPLKTIDSTSSGQMVSLIVSDADRVGEGLLLTFEQLFTGALTIIAIIIIMLVKEISIAGIPYITLLVLFLTPISVFIAKFISKKSYVHFKRRAEVNAKQIAFINEMVTNEKVVKTFNREEKVMERFDEINEQNRKASLTATFYSSTVNPTTRFVYNLIYAVICLCGAFLIIGGNGLSVGDLFVFLSYANQYTKPFNEISGVITELQYSLACVDRITNLTELPNETDGEKVAELNGNIEFKGVDFSYNPNKKLIEDLNIKVKAGQNIAIVGPTGCGKTTLINLLVRFYDTQGGVIEYDGHNVEEFTRSSLRHNIGMVLQDCFVFTGSIKDNVKLGKPNATDQEVIQACKKSFASEFIEKFENGYDTIISENSGLSQGQKQLLSIARIMLISPPILILDEATSSIDFRTEKKIQEGIHNLSVGKTTFTVAHRLATIVNADLILVMKDGTVIEQGTHSQLLASGGFYSQLYNSQFE